MPPILLVLSSLLASCTMPLPALLSGFGVPVHQYMAQYRSFENLFFAPWRLQDTETPAVERPSLVTCFVGLDTRTTL